MNWGYEPLLAEAWQRATRSATRHVRVGEVVHRDAAARASASGAATISNCPSAGCRRPRRFAGSPRTSSATCRGSARSYNAAIRAYREANGIRSDNHPAPELAEGEAPFWVRTATAAAAERATAGERRSHAPPACA